MKKIGGASLFLLAVIASLFYFSQSAKVSAQTNRIGKVRAVFKSDKSADLALADKIGQLTDRSGQSLSETKASDGGIELDLGGGFQNVMLARLEDDGEPVAACITSPGEADAFFGRNLRTGAAVPKTEIHKDPIAAIAARQGMSKEEFEFYSNLIAQAEKNRQLSPGSATITISNADGAGEGFNDATAKAPEGGNNGTTLGQQRLNLFNYAAGIWGAYLDTSVPIVVSSQFNSLTPCSSSGGVLGSAGATGLTRDFTGAPIANTWYPTALASKVSGVDRNGATAEINATFNSDVDTGCLGSGTRFYYGLDNATPSGTVNLLTVLLHEMGHGLGFSSSVNGATGQLAGSDAQGRYPDAFTRLIYDRTTGKYWPQMTDAERVTSSTNDGNVLFDGPNVKIASSFLTAGRENSTGRVSLYTPSPYQSGSSISHWDTIDTPNLLMEPYINSGLPLTLDLTRQVMRDIGWYRDSNGDLTADTITGVQVGGTNPTVGSTVTVSWTNNGGFSRNVIIDLSTDGGSTFPVVLASNVANTSSYNVTLPNNTSSTAQIRVREYDFVAPTGSSATFAISAAAAQPVDITGRVFYKSGRPVPGKIILALQASGFPTQYTRVNQFGYFRFARVPAGGTYTITILGKNYTFAPQTVTTGNGNVSGLIFTAQ